MSSERNLAPAVEGADLLALVEIALEEARALGATQAEAAISMDVGLSVSVRLGEVETIEYQRDRGMGVTVYFGTRKGSASTADLSTA
ncbi:MAG TPA: DNA gyrase modulator, partial [Steroidobacteraceae bacterium]|nr:DNA gyrase modulator [Steroidobacteraceae bacterium]